MLDADDVDSNFNKQTLQQIMREVRVNCPYPNDLSIQETDSYKTAERNLAEVLLAIATGNGIFYGDQGLSRERSTLETVYKQTLKMGPQEAKLKREDTERFIQETIDSMLGAALSR